MKDITEIAKSDDKFVSNVISALTDSDKLQYEIDNASKYDDVDVYWNETVIKNNLEFVKDLVETRKNLGLEYDVDKVIQSLNLKDNVEF